MSEQAHYALWNGVGEPFTFHSADLPEPADGEALVRIDLATICGSDLHTVSGRRESPAPSVLGHEQVGTVIAGPHRGQRVVWSVTASCGHCARCRRDLPQKCLELRKFGHERHDPGRPLNGGFATHALLRNHAIVPVPDDLPDEVAAPAACATATVAAVVKAAGETRKRTALVTGAGMLGLTAAAMLAERGAYVIVADPDPDRRALARRFGAAEAVPDARQQRDIDVALELSGAVQAVEQSLAALAVGGTLVLAGTVKPGPAVVVDPERVVRNWQTITGVHNYHPDDLRAAVDFLAGSSYPFAELVEGSYPLEELGEAFTRAGPRVGVRVSS